jgi:hypothetical protein
MDHRLLLVFGLPRSGTSWLGKIFDSHPDTLYRHEPDSRYRLKDVPLLPSITSAEQFREEVQAFVKELPAMRSAKVAAKLPLFPKSYYSFLRYGLFRLGVIATRATENIFIESRAPAFVDYGVVNNLTVVWKSIESVGRIGTIIQAIPGARAILLIRNPCGYAASVLRGESKGKFRSATPASDDWGVFEQLMATPQADAKGATLATIRRLRPIERLAWRWLIINEKAIEELEGQAACTVVQYEHLCRQPEEVTRMLFEHANLAWSNQTWKFIKRSTGRTRAGYYSVFKDPIESANRWQKELAANDIRRIVSIVKDSKAGQLYPFE